MGDLIGLDDAGRMVATDRDALTADVVNHLRQAAVGLVALGSHQDAVVLLTKALELADDRRSVALHLNLGDAHRHAGDLEAAEPHYQRARRLAEAHAPGLVSFCFQHLGKQRLDQGRIVEARALLETAMALRVAQGDAELIESTEAALRLVSFVERDG